MIRYTQWVLKHPLLTLFILLVPTLYFTWRLPELEVNNGVVAAFSPEDPDLLYYQDFYKEFGNEEFICVFFNSEDIFNLQTLQWIDRMTKRFEEIPYVDQVLSITSFGSAYNQEETLVMGSLGDELGSLQPSDMERVRKRVLSDPLYTKALLLSKDGNAVFIALVLEKLSSLKYTGQVVQQVRAIIAEEESREGVDLVIGGTPFYLVETQKAYIRDNQVMTPILLFVVFGVLLTVFRNPWLSLTPLVVSGLSLIWTFGFVVSMGRFVTPLTEIILPLLLVYGVLNSVHLLSVYRQVYRKGGPSEEVVLRSLSEIAKPCLWASITTAIGFLSLMASSVTIIYEFGFYSAFGVMVSYFFTFTLLPLGLHRWRWIPSPKMERQGSFVQKMVLSLIDLTEKYRNFVLMSGVGVIALFAFWATRITVDTDYLKLFREDAEVIQNERLASKWFGSWSPLEFSIRYRDGRDVLEYSALQEIEKFQGYLESLPSIDKSLSVADVVRKANQELRGGDSQFYVIPQDKRALDRLAFFLEGLGGERGLRSYLSSDRTRMRMTARTHVLPSKEFVKLFGQMESYIQQEIDPQLEIKPTGDTFLGHKMTARILDTEIQSFSLAFLLIFIVILLALRSWRLAVIAIPPNLFPVVIMLGTMGKMGISLNIGTCTIASVLISMAVDDTIHFLHKFRNELEKKKDCNAAVKATMEGVGIPIVYTSLVLAAGFWVLIFSSFVPAIHFGFLSGVGVLGALLGDVIILPALLMWLKPRATLD
ncbi:MAG: MMPL family transporter [Deltaproteobacteria bacterium]|nr:MMPL family transporter [Deltaproteobacteria bacterium]